MTRQVRSPRLRRYASYALLPLLLHGAYIPEFLLIGFPLIAVSVASS
jgi:hypothetical protein